MPDSPPGVRQRASKKKSASSPAGIASGSEDETIAKTKARDVPVLSSKPPSQLGHKLGLVVVTVAAFITRFWKINHPDQVVFDEVHFGKVGLPFLFWVLGLKMG